MATSLDYKSPQTDEATMLESPTATAVNTAVNTANPSRAPSPQGGLRDDSELEDVLMAKEIGVLVGEENPDGGNAPPDGKRVSDIDPNTHIIGWDGPNDPQNPMNFSRTKKWCLTMITAMMTFCVSFASSVFSTATYATAAEFGASPEVMILGVSLYVLGFSCGPLVWGPASELYGRSRPLFLGFAIFVILNIGVGLAQNVWTIMICRFLAGCFGAAPIAIVGGLYVDFWDVIDRGVATAGFSGATFLGPTMGPIVGEFLTKSSLGWRWTAWITIILSAFFGIIGFLFVPETFEPVLHKRKAEQLRHQTKNWALHAKMDENPVHVRALIEKYFSKPFVMLFQEPILMAMTIYSSLVYSILYLIFEAYPYSFQVIRGWESGIGSLPFIAILGGIVICCVYIAVDTKTRFQQALKRSGKMVLPEARLPPMIIGSIILPMGLFWFAWTSNPSISWVPQVLSGIFIGCGIFLVFLPSQIYIIDVYLLNANSALAASACARALMAAGFPLFATQMYERLGVDWATSLLGFICVVMIPFPVLFYMYGEKLRARGKYTFNI